MARQPDIDGVLIEWGDRLFYPGNRRVHSKETWSPSQRHRRAATIRARIAATVVRRAPQVMVKVTGGGRGMKAIVAHLNYISKRGRVPMIDERGEVAVGKEAVREMADDWRYGGALIEEVSHRREAFNIILSMLAGTNATIVEKSAREFAEQEFHEHKYVMVLHDHQANPHVHLSVRAESAHGRRLNPRKGDLQRWRETFAEKLRGWGVDAEATRQATRGVQRRYPEIWQVKSAQEGRLRKVGATSRGGHGATASREQAIEAWRNIADALGRSSSQEDRLLGQAVSEHLGRASVQREFAKGPDDSRVR